MRAHTPARDVQQRVGEACGSGRHAQHARVDVVSLDNRATICYCEATRSHTQTAGRHRGAGIHDQLPSLHGRATGHHVQAASVDLDKAVAPNVHDVGAVCRHLDA